MASTVQRPRKILENGMDWYKGDDFISVLVMHGKWKRQLDRIRKKDPDSIKITTTNKDGSYIAQIPADWVDIKKPSKRKLSDEQKAQLTNRLNAYRDQISSEE